MKLWKIGHHNKTRGPRILADNELAPSDVRVDEGFPGTSWGWHLELQMTGYEGPRFTNDYQFEFSADDLALFIETALTNGSTDGEIRAQAKAMGNYIRELLNIKNNPADT